MYFELLRSRLVSSLREKVRSGVLTERGLARRTGISQPHLHNVLKGVRKLSAERADEVIQHLDISVLDLLREEELSPHGRSGTRALAAFRRVPLLAASIGPDRPFPDLTKWREHIPFQHSEVEAMDRPVAARLDPDCHLPQPFHADDIVLLEPLERGWEMPADDGYYAIDLGGSSLIRRVERVGNALLVSGDEATPEATCISRADRNILEVVRARVTWIGHSLERSTSAARTIEKAGGEHRSAGGEG